MPMKGFELDPNALILDDEGSVPLVYWPVTPNFGDLLSPWLFGKITGRRIRQVRAKVVTEYPISNFFDGLNRRKLINQPHYVGIGSIMSRVRDESHVWGTGAFGTEQFFQLNRKAKYHAVRGPLSRQLLRNVGVEVPEVYGDPALLTPYFYEAPAEKTHEIGLVLRWSDFDWKKSIVQEGIKIVDLGSDDVEQTLSDILSCKRIITSSLHGLIIADAYNVPSAFLASDTPKGGIFKYLDYFASVKKFREPISFDFGQGALTVERLDAEFQFIDDDIDFDSDALLRSCPFLRPKET